MRLNLSFLLLVTFFAQGRLLAQCDFFEDYSTNAGWTQVGVDVEIVNGKMKYLNGSSDQTMQRRVHSPLGTTLDSNDCWVAELEFNPQIVGTKNGQPYTGHVVLALTAGTQEPYKDCPDLPCTGLPNGSQDGIVITYIAYNPPDGTLFFKIHARNGGIEYQSTNTIIAPHLDTTYFVRASRISPTQVELSVFWDANRTNALANSPISFTIPAGVTGLTTVQHGNVVRGEYRRQLTGYLDNLCINWSGLNLIDSLKLPNDTSLCDGENLIIDIGMGNDYSYSWNTGINDSIISINQPGIYIATVKKGCGTSTDTVVVSYKNSAPINLPDDTVLCPGDTLTLNIGQGSNASYLWNTGSTDSVLIISQPGIYVANVSNPCSVSDTIKVSYKEALTPQLKDTTFCLSSVSRISYTNMNASFLWNTGETTNSISPTETGWYFVEVTNNCETFVDSAYVELNDCPDCHVFIPNSFTPGNDGMNDYFGPVTNCPQIEYSLKIFDRWGNLVADLNETTGGWDGMHEGKYLQSAVFTYRFEYIIPGTIPVKRDWLNGIVTIIR